MVNDNNILFYGCGGSWAYGLNTLDSDVDRRGVKCNDAKDILLMRDFRTYENKELDIVIYSLNHFAQLLKKGAPNCIELLGTSPSDIYDKSAEWDELIQNKDKILSKKLYKSFGGAARALYEEVKKQTSKSPLICDSKRYKKVCKMMSHSIRYLRMGLEMLSYGEINTKRTDDYLLIGLKSGMYLRNGAPSQEYKDMFEAHIASLKVAKIKSKLPDEPNAAWINSFVTRTNAKVVERWIQNGKRERNS